MNVWISAILLTLTAGFINGSFAVPAKHTKHWAFENTWFNFALWAFLIFPWLVLFILKANALSIYFTVPLTMLLTLLIGGTLFGVGQICFALALNRIGTAH